MSLAPPDEHKVGRDSISMNQQAGGTGTGTGTGTGSPGGSPTSSPRLRAKPGLLHSLKQKIFSGQHSSDPEFEVARRKFMQLHDALVKIHTQAKNFINNVTNTIHSAHFVSDEFSALFNEGGSQHAYNAMIDAMNTGHDTLDSDAVLKAYVDQYNTSVLRRLTEELEHHRAVQTRMADRDQVKADVDYYKTKVDKLQGEHDKRLSSGKQEASKETEKFSRNMDKLNNVKSDYNELNHTLIAELHRMWNERQPTLGPIVADFVAMEKQFISIYNQAIQNIPGPDTQSQHEPSVDDGSVSTTRQRGLSDAPSNDQPIEITPATQQQQPYQTQVLVTPDTNVYQQQIHPPQPAGNYATTNGIQPDVDLIQQQQQQHQQHVHETNYAQQQANGGPVPTEGYMEYAQQHAQQMDQQQAQQSQPQRGVVHDQVPHHHDVEHEGPDSSGLPAPIQYGESGAIIAH